MRLLEEEPELADGNFVLIDIKSRDPHLVGRGFRGRTIVIAHRKGAAGHKQHRSTVAVAHDGALLVSEDGNGTLWRISRTEPQQAQ